jgi:hypothetical protein
MKFKTKQAELFYRLSRTEADYKIKGLKEFVAFVYSRPFWSRVRIAFRLVFKRVKL